MELKIRPASKNNYPIGGILIKSGLVKDWLFEIQKMGFNLLKIEAYPIPNTIANSIWGCLLVTDLERNKIDIGKNSFCQLVNGMFLIPENAQIFPRIGALELEKLCKQNKHILHPDFGLVELLEKMDWASAIQMPILQRQESIQPAHSVFIPKQIKSFQIKAVAPENILDNLEKTAFPKPEKFEDTSLNFLEKAKLAAYKTLFSKSKERKSVEETSFLDFLEKIAIMFGKDKNWSNDLQKEYENLEERNQKQLDKFLELIRNNPEEALKYAIPLDNDSTNRGGDKGVFHLSRRWFDFSLSTNQRTGSGNVMMADDTFAQLNKQYNQTAEQLIKQKNFEKAAFVYMKLLKNNFMAAQTLENGRLYQEAAAVYIKYLNNKQKAAECYEKGSMTTEAIELFKELKQEEKVGDLYMSINQEKEAFIHYEKVIDTYKSSFQFVKASFIYKNKMNNENEGQSMLLSGWRAKKDAFNCLNNYFENIKDDKYLLQEIQEIYSKEVIDSNCEIFLKVIKYEYEKQKETQESVKEIAYEIIAQQAPKNAAIVNELRNFNKEDKHLIKDLMRFKVSKS